MAVIALAGSFGGASLAAILPAGVFKPIIVVALVAVALFTAVTIGGYSVLQPVPMPSRRDRAMSWCVALSA